MKVYQDAGGDIYSIILVNKAGRVKRLYTPFRVVCIKPVVGIKVSTHVYVEAVLGTVHGRIYYVILGQPYQHTCFHIIMHF